MITRLSLMRAAPLGVLLGLTLANAQAADRPEVPEPIKAPPGEQVVLRAHASGAQVYVCGRGADGKPQWTLKAPQAELWDEKRVVIGRHYAGPSWRHNDGSEVTGKQTIAEFAENAEIIQMLTSLGVDYAQGYGVAQPQRVLKSAVA